MKKWIGRSALAGSALFLALAAAAQQRPEAPPAPAPPASSPPAAAPPVATPQNGTPPEEQAIRRKTTYSAGRDFDLGALRLSDLLPFGANLFASDGVIESVAGVPPDYVIAIGDRIDVQMWGAVELLVNGVVDGQGHIFIPRVGPVAVAGLQFRELNARVLEAVRTVYTTNVNVYTNMPQSAAIGVFVTGYVRLPGRHLGRSIDSVLSFLRRAGGIDLVRGSFRSIYVRRGDRVVLNVDLYPFLQSGILPRFQFMEGDTIVVGPRGPAARVGGAVQNAAVFELGGATAAGRQIIALARPESAATHVYVRQTRAGRTSQVYVERARFAASAARADDEIVFFKDPVEPTLTVTAEGAVVGQTVFTAQRGTKLSHVLHFIHADPRLAALDSIHIRRRSVAEAQKRLLDEDLRRTQEALLKSEKLSRGEIEIRTREAELLRRVIETLQGFRPTGIVVLRRGGAAQDITLENEDVVVVPRKSDVVAIAGEVLVPQTFRFEPGKTVADYLRLAGGVTELGRSDKFIVYRLNGEALVGAAGPVEPGDQILFLPYIRTNLLQVAVDITEVLARAAVLGRLASVF
jgi:protein involved in polysaccharide export with SLBB domain